MVGVVISETTITLPIGGNECTHLCTDHIKIDPPKHFCMKMAVIGSRNFSNYEQLKKTLDEIPGIKKLISGGAAGADSLAETWAKEHNIETVIYKPDWAKYGRGAGVVRNRLIIEDCDWCIAFWDGTSKGTKSSIEYAKKQNKKLTVVHY